MRQWTRTRTRAAILLAALAFLAGAALLLRESRAVLIVEDRRSGEQWRFVLPDERFALGFTHSVMKTPVEERYRVDPDDGLVLVEAIYQSYGVGLPFLPEEGELTVEDGVFTLRMNRVVGRLNMTVSNIPEHWLEVGGERFALSELFGGEQASIAIDVVYERTWRFATRRALGTLFP